MALLEAKPALSTSVFDKGNLNVKQIKLKKSDASKPPSPLFILSPIQKDTYPVLLFRHGFCILDTFYTHLFEFISSHGFIVVAIGDQVNLFTLFTCCCSNNVEAAAKVADWLSNGGLDSSLPENVKPDLKKVALAGHSKGGKTAFSLALGLAETSLEFSALIGIDPVAGPCILCRPPPRILTYIPRAFSQKIPIAVIGTGLGSKWKCIVPPFAPYGCNHSEFYNESEPPASYFLAKDYGHTDMLDDFPAWVCSFFVKSGKGPKELMRRSVGGIVVAFLEAKLKGNPEDFNAIVDGPSVAPILLDPVISVPA
ncbi:hypothetical protein LguiA_011531 [Lonicera macranthoides]